MTRIGNVPFHSVAETNDDHNRGNTDDNTQHGEERTHFAAEDIGYGKGKAFCNFHAPVPPICSSEKAPSVGPS